MSNVFVGYVLELDYILRCLGLTMEEAASRGKQLRVFEGFTFMYGEPCDTEYAAQYVKYITEKSNSRITFCTTPEQTDVLGIRLSKDVLAAGARSVQSFVDEVTEAKNIFYRELAKLGEGLDDGLDNSSIRFFLRDKPGYRLVPGIHFIDECYD